MPKRTSLPHIPRLDTILMVEDAIESAGELRSKAELLRRLPRKVMYQTFNRILEYLQYSNKIVVLKNGRQYSRK